MPDSISYTPEEVAKYLKISKYTVYELIKRGELSAYRVGRKVRVEENDLEAYIRNKKKLATASLASENGSFTAPSPSAAAASAPQQSPSGFSSAAPASVLNEGLIICGQDMILDILTRHLERQFPNVRFLRNYIGSIDGLIALYRGQANAVTAHLWDSDTDEYNLPYIRRLMPGDQTTVINLVSRFEGFYVKAGNPKNIKTWSDLTRSGVRFINRERGSGARVLLDEKLRVNNITHYLIKGYNDEEMSHMAVASRVARGEADVGLGIEKVAMQVEGLDFIPLQKERYDLVVLKDDLNKPQFQALLQVVSSQAYRNEVQGLGGYDVSRMGEIIKQ